MYNDRNECIGTVRRTECDRDYLESFKAINPCLHIAPVYFGNDAALVIWVNVFEQQTGLASLERLKAANA